MIPETPPPVEACSSPRASNELKEVEPSSPQARNEEVYTPPLFSSPEGSPESESPPRLHTVAFKAMGTTLIPGAQRVLQDARDLTHSGIELPVVIVPEPDNPVDNNAIAFKCKVGSKWCKFGYAVRSYR